MTWYVLMVLGGTEEGLVKRIESEVEGIEAYFPKKTLWRKVRRSQRKKGQPWRERRTYPLVPGYIFLRFDLEVIGVGWLSRYRYAYGLIGVGEAPSKIRDSDMIKIRSSELDGKYDETRDWTLGLIGKTYDIIGGLLAGQSAKVVSIEDSQFVLEVAGSSVRTKIKVAAFEQIRQSAE